MPRIGISRSPTHSAAPRNVPSPRCLSRTRCPRANRLPYSCCRKGLFRSPKDNMRNPRLPTPGSLSFQVLRKIRAINRNIRPDTGFHISRYSSSVTHSITLSAQEGAVPPVHCRCRCRCCHKRKRHHNRNAQGYGLSMVSSRLTRSVTCILPSSDGVLHISTRCASLSSTAWAMRDAL